MLNILNSSMESINVDEQIYYTSSNYTYLAPSAGNSLVSESDSTYIDFNGASYKSTEIYSLCGNHNRVHVMATDIVKVSIWDNSKISFTYSYYSLALDRWYSQYHPEENISSGTYISFEGSFSSIPYGYFWFWNDGNIESFTATVWTSLLW